MKKIISGILSVLLILALFQCESISNNEKIGINEVEVFDNGILTLTSDTQVAVPDSLITIKMRCLPLYSGRGRVILQVVSGDSVFVEAPEKDTIGAKYPGALANQIDLAAEFMAIDRFEQDWKVFLKENETGYAFEGYVYLDSVRTPEDSLVHIESEDARELIPPGSKFHNYASSERFLFLSPPSKL